jgi:hypothetical protein
MDFPFPEPQVSGVGEIRNPPLTRDEVNQIRTRAEQQTDRQTRKDLFALLAALEAK